MDLRYIIYARKSTESEDKQVTSIEDQILEANKYSKANNLEIVKTYSEAKSSFHANKRTEFYKVIEDIKSGLANAILVWDTDRLSRNPYDTGLYQNLLHEGILKEITTPRGEHITANTIETGLKGVLDQEKSRKLSVDVKRGMKRKCERGEFPRAALLGYDTIGEEGHRNLSLNPQEAPIIKKAFELAGEGYSLGYILKKVSEMGLRTKYKKQPLSKSQLHYILKNTSYFGVFKYNGEQYIGSYTPLITKTLFLEAQAGLQARSKPKLLSHGIHLNGLIKCGNCGCAVSTTVKNKFVKKTNKIETFHYYRCTHRKGNCSQPPINDSMLKEELGKLVQLITIDEETWKLGIELFKAKNDSEKHKQVANLTVMNQRLETIKSKIFRLIDMFTEGLITNEEFKSQKAALVNEQKDIEEKLSSINSETDNWFELAENFIDTAFQARKILQSDNEEEKVKLLKTVGSNYFLMDKKLDISFNKPWDILAKPSDSPTWLPD